mmetsp:Transcript_14456/g.29347  ORF Transcript_14456/g.29347 Transcript_14456/m.29347 type:complete len:588 (-) Transcript_14456:2335-4098(-)
MVSPRSLSSSSGIYEHQSLFNREDPNSINSHCFGVICHRQYTNRICEALRPTERNKEDDGWIKIIVDSSAPLTSIQHDRESSTSCFSQRVQGRTKLNNNVENRDKANDQITVIPTAPEKGVRKNRTGYQILVIRHALISPSELPPMARKQISWVGRLTHRTFLNSQQNGENSDENAKKKLRIEGLLAKKKEKEKNEKDLSSKVVENDGIFAKVADEILRKLTANGFNLEKDTLRMDVHPKSLNDTICSSLQLAATYHTILLPSGAQGIDDTTNKNACSGPDHGPIKMTRSATNCYMVVNIVVHSLLTSNSIKEVFWGISTNKEHWEDLNQRMNDHATKEVLLETTDSITGYDRRKQDTSRSKHSSSQIRKEVPVSRAFYKLNQVFDDEHLLRTLASLRKSKIGPIGAGLDIGASPGGWTQVLHHKVKLPTVVAVDPGVLAKRVDELPGVIHLRGEITTKDVVDGIAKYAPYSIVVCDACVDAHNLLPKIIESLEGVNKILMESEKSLFILPLCLVLTFKMPYKTVGSLNKNLEKLSNVLPEYLSRLALLGCCSSRENDGGKVEVRYKICHLFANSESERSVISTFSM